MKKTQKEQIYNKIERLNVALKERSIRNIIEYFNNLRGLENAYKKLIRISKDKNEIEFAYNKLRQTRSKLYA